MRTDDIIELLSTKLLLLGGELGTKEECVWTSHGSYIGKIPLKRKYQDIC